MSWRAYSILPIDFGWEMLPTVQETAGRLARAQADSVVAGYADGSNAVAVFLKNFANAKELARKAGWEGDYRSGSEPRVFWLPDEHEFSHAFVWKHDNNGDTFVISPRPLTWLAEWENG